MTLLPGYSSQVRQARSAELRHHPLRLQGIVADDQTREEGCLCGSHGLRRAAPKRCAHAITCARQPISWHDVAEHLYTKGTDDMSCLGTANVAGRGHPSTTHPHHLADLACLSGRSSAAVHPAVEALTLDLPGDPHTAAHLNGVRRNHRPPDERPEMTRGCFGPRPRCRDRADHGHDCAQCKREPSPSSKAHHYADTHAGSGTKHGAENSAYGDRKDVGVAEMVP